MLVTRFCKIIYLQTLKLFQSFRWKLVDKKAFSISDEFVNDNDSLFNDSLIIAPHADDELLGCYSVLKQNRPFVYLCSLTGSNGSSTNKKTREKEFIECADFFGYEYAISGGDIVGDIKNLLTKRKPSYVFIPSYIDWHEEHRYISKIVFDLVKAGLFDFKCKIVLYSVSVPLPRSLINICNVLDSPSFKEKFDVFYRLYPSQKNLNIKRFMFYQKCWIRKKTAEVFSILDLYDWEKIYCDLKEAISEESFMSLKTNLNNVKLVNAYVNSLIIKRSKE